MNEEFRNFYCNIRKKSTQAMYKRWSSLIGIELHKKKKNLAFIRNQFCSTQTTHNSIYLENK